MKYEALFFVLAVFGFVSVLVLQIILPETKDKGMINSLEEYNGMARRGELKKTSLLNFNQ